MSSNLTKGGIGKGRDWEVWGKEENGMGRALEEDGDGHWGED